MRVRVRASLDPSKLAALNVPRSQGWLCVQVEPEYRPKMAEQLEALAKRQRTKFTEAVEKWNAKPLEFRGKEPQYQDFLLDLELDLTIHFRKRSIDANNLYWKIREIQANWVNGSPAYRRAYFSKLAPGHVVTPEELHKADIEALCEKREWTILRKDRISFERGMEFAELGRITSTRDDPEFEDRIKVTVTRTTSFFTTKEFSEWVNRLINEITDSGLLRSDEAEFAMLRADFKTIVDGKKGH